METQTNSNQDNRVSYLVLLEQVVYRVLLCEIVSRDEHVLEEADRTVGEEVRSGELSLVLVVPEGGMHVLLLARLLLTEEGSKGEVDIFISHSSFSHRQLSNSAMQ